MNQGIWPGFPSEVPVVLGYALPVRFRAEDPRWKEEWAAAGVHDVAYPGL